MKKIAGLWLFLCMLLPAMQGKAQTAALATEQSSSTKFITEQNGIKVFVHYTASASDGKSTPQVNFYNTNDKDVVVKWTVKSKEGIVVMSDEMSLLAGRLTTSSVSYFLSGALEDKSYTFEINLKN